jgi:hypothetical protein
MGRTPTVDRTRSGPARQTKRLGALPCLLALIISSGATAQLVPMTIIPGKIIAPNAKEPLNIRSQFEIRNDKSDGEPFIQSNGSGGAGMVAQFPVVPQICGAALPACKPTVGDAAYCIRENPTDNEGTCWERPKKGWFDGNPSRIKMQGPGIFDVPGEVGSLGRLFAASDTFDARNFASLTGVTKWRLYSCLNGQPGSCSVSPPVEGSALRRAGPIYIPHRVKDYPRGLGPFPVIAWLAIAAAAIILALAVVRLKIGQRKR